MLEDLAEDLRSVYHIEVLTFTGDVGDPSFVKALAEEMLAHFSQIDGIPYGWMEPYQMTISSE